MQTPAETKQTSSNKVLIVVGIIVIALLAAIVAILLLRPATTNIDDDGVPKIGYAADATVMLDQNSLQAAFDEAMRNAAEGNVGLKYRNDAFSTNGVDFECRIINSDSNIFDMFLTIFTDPELTDQIFLSGLVPPGSGFEKITLDRALDEGDHMVYVVLTQVDTDEETGAQVIKNQITHTMDFHVSGN